MMHILTKLPGEMWEPIRGADGYAVSSLGRVRHGLHELKGRSYTNSGYAKMHLGAGTDYYVHRLVAEAFVPNPFGLPEVNHKNGNKLDNRAENLEWVSHADNMKHAWENGLVGRRQGKRRPVVFYDRDGERVFASVKEAAEAVGRATASVHYALINGTECAGGYWRDAE